MNDSFIDSLSSSMFSGWPCMFSGWSSMDMLGGADWCEDSPCMNSINSIV
jgi:hypothetical protein